MNDQTGKKDFEEFLPLPLAGTYRKMRLIDNERIAEKHDINLLQLPRSPLCTIFMGNYNFSAFNITFVIIRYVYRPVTY